MIKVENTIEIYEIGGIESSAKDKVIKIHSHWNRSEMVDIEFPGFDKITVSAGDMIIAITNARNNGRF